MVLTERGNESKGASYLIWRCRPCNRERTAVDGCEFFSWRGNRNRLDLRTIMLLVQAWVWRRQTIDVEVSKYKNL
jgi:hypothetical protein